MQEKSIEDLERDYVNKIKRQEDIEKPTCPICSKPIYIIHQAVTHKESGEPAHFDCILKTLRETNALEQNERIVYLGGGSFGIVQDRSGGHTKMKFFVRKRIQYEERKKQRKPDDKSVDEIIEDSKKS